MSYLRNAWYAAGWVGEAVDDKFSRTILGKSVLFFRLSDGGWAAVENRCPHRFAPLENGVVTQDTIRCGYHGLQFDRMGRCVHNPIGNRKIPAAARINSYPVVERFRMVWIWLGEASAADPGLLPDYVTMDNPDLVHATGGYLYCKANYRLIADNLLDLSHVAFLHPLIGDQSMSRGKLTVSAEGRAVQSKFWMADTAAPPAVNFVYPTGSSVDQWLDMRWQAPSNLFLDFGLVGVGLLRERSAYHGYAYHVLTPETDVTTHYFFGVSMPAGVGSAAAEQLHDLQKSVFSNEDKPMLEDCQRSMGTTDLWSLKPVILGGDRGAIRARQMLDRLIDEESSPTLPAT